MGKVDLRLKVDAELLAHAEKQGVSLEQALEQGIRAALRPTAPADTESAARQWAEENAAAIKDHEQRIAEYGVFGEDLRTW